MLLGLGISPPDSLLQAGLVLARRGTPRACLAKPSTDSDNTNRVRTAHFGLLNGRQRAGKKKVWELYFRRAGAGRALDVPCPTNCLSMFDRGRCDHMMRCR